MSHDSQNTLLEVRDLRVSFGAHDAVRGISFDIAAGETLALVGESGSGKSATALALMRLLPEQARVSGSLRFDARELLALRERDARDVRGRQISMIFQEPMTSLNPVLTIGEQIVETLRAHEPLSKAAAFARAVELLDLVEIAEPQRRVHDYPHELSGGQRQRVMIAMALACRPRLLIADEPTTALDVTIQSRILSLLDTLRRELRMALLLITHDLGVVADRADRVAVMLEGRIVEQASTAQTFSTPRHPYTRGLLGASLTLADELHYRERALPEIRHRAVAQAAGTFEAMRLEGGRGGSGAARGQDAEAGTGCPETTAADAADARPFAKVGASRGRFDGDEAVSPETVAAAAQSLANEAIRGRKDRDEAAGPEIVAADARHARRSAKAAVHAPAAASDACFTQTAMADAAHAQAAVIDAAGPHRTAAPAHEPSASAGSPPVTNGAPMLLSIRDLRVDYSQRHGGAALRAVDGVSLDIARGESVGLVGESGCGKSTLSRAIMRLVPAAHGEIRLHGVDLAPLRERALRPLRRRVQMVFQDPYASLNSRRTIGQMLDATLAVNGVADTRARRSRARAILERVRLPASALGRFPHEFSGGQRQRIGIARALVLEPELLICDEPVSALDVSIQAQILNLLVELKKELGLALLFISHDLSVVRYIADRVHVMRQGRIVESGDHRSIWREPQHPYTRALLDAIPGRARVARDD
ncbi:MULTISPECIES: ABC transporter ATP-binding protein [Burkholderia]|uniref:ABC transporter ATP-binding protein n=1 Tax=Burkholderia TaxID=32008 RepID=UPI000A6B6CE7|nr:MULTISPECIES: ABC transporter ATP-binding protein [unclassified Burkholderia]